MNEDQIRQFLDNYGQALSAGDLDAVAGCWDIPALVLSDVVEEISRPRMD